MRVYDPRIGKFLSVDPLTGKYPELTPYQFASNRPVDGVDQDGKEWMQSQARLMRDNAIMKIDETRVKSFIKIPTLSAAPHLDQVQQYQQEQYRVQRYQDANLNDDGSKPPLMRLAENKTFKNFAENIAFPAMDALALADGVGELRSLYKGAKLASNPFSMGGTKLVSSEMLAQFPASTTIGNPLETFIAPTPEIDALLSQGLSRIKIAEKLGIKDPAFLKGDLIRVDLNSKALKDLNIRLPTGNEVGANSLFVPGGKTVGGVTEGVVNGIPKQASGVSVKVIPPK